MKVLERFDNEVGQIAIRNAFERLTGRVENRASACPPPRLQVVPIVANDGRLGSRDGSFVADVPNCGRIGLWRRVLARHEQFELEREL